MTGLFLNIIQLMSYSWSVTPLIFHFPEAMQHNLVLRHYTHSLEQDQLQIELKPYLPYVLTHTRTETRPPLVQSSKSTPHTLNYPIQPPSKTSLFQSRYSQSNHHEQVRSIKILSSLNYFPVQQSVPFANAIHLQSTNVPHLQHLSNRKRIQNPVEHLQWNFFAKKVDVSKAYSKV